MARGPSSDQAGSSASPLSSPRLGRVRWRTRPRTIGATQAVPSLCRAPLVKPFTCLIRLDGQPVVSGTLRRYAPGASHQLGTDSPWLIAGCFAANIGAQVGESGPIIVREGQWICVGHARLDKFTTESDCAQPENLRTDLALVLALIANRGGRAIPDILGDFAFVAWHELTHQLFAARDALGVRTLFYAQEGSILTISSHASSLARAQQYDPEFFADYLVLGNDPAEPNPFHAVNTVPSGTVLTYNGRSLSQMSYWSPLIFAEGSRADESTCVEKFRELFRGAVAARLGGRADVWAQLSGGLDSSAVVCIAHALAEEGVVPAGLGGTITMADSMGEGEQEFADAVLQMCGLRNERVVDYWAWQDDGLPPPRTEAPTNNYPMFARDRRCCEMVWNGGGRVLLSGQGSDQYLYGTLCYLADWVVQRRWRDVFWDALYRAVLERSSFWLIMFRNAVVPLLPASMRRLTFGRALRTPDWIVPAIARKYEMASRHGAARILGGPPGRKYPFSMAYEIGHFGRYSNLTLFDEVFDVRHPFLYRPLIEMCLGLAPHHCSRPLRPKAILREAMEGILPEVVRTRTGKGGIDSRIAWSLVRERRRVARLIRDPLLAQWGFVEPRRLAAEVDAILAGREASVVPLMATLSAETWLQVRSGQWTVEERAPPRASELAYLPH
ncbi:MAG: asparagine synthase-related protein [Gemmatimonadales bacterium]